MHPRNRHQNRYDLEALARDFPPLEKVIIKTKYNQDSIDFADPKSVKILNQAMLKSFYGIHWELPEKFLCPPVPGRSDYIHHLADLIGTEKRNARILDIGVGANCIYPIIGACEYGWNFVGSDINPEALEIAEEIIARNENLKAKIELRRQEGKSIFRNIIKPGEQFEATMCNPPFHASAEAAKESTLRKWKNLGKRAALNLNFGGMSSELWTEGGESAFIRQMIEESVSFSPNCQWFTTLVSKEENLPFLMKMLEHAKVKRKQILEISQGQKRSRILCWSFGPS